MNMVEKLGVYISLMLIVAFSSLLVAPQISHAQFAVIDVTQVHQNTLDAIREEVAEASQLSVSWMDVVKNTISAIADVSTQINTFMIRLKQWVFDPLAFILSGNALKAITAGVIDFVNGKTNGTGAPSFAQNLGLHLLNNQDAQEMAFFSEFSRNSNSIFGAQIISSVRNNYYTTTSGAGFWAANRSTLPQYSQDPLAFVGGDFSQGGWNAWFALTTQPQNNPYTQYYRTQAELAGRTQFAVTRELEQLAWGNGFLSWCASGADVCPAGQEFNPSFETCAPVSAATPAQESCPAGQVWNSSFQTCAPTSVGAGPTSSGCSDGSNISTPGSVIKAGLDRVLGSTIGKLENMGDIGPEVNTIMSNLQNILAIGSFGAELFGASGGGGLFGASQIGSGQTVSPIRQFQTQPGFLGATQQTANATGNAPAPPNPNLGSNATAAETSAVATLPVIPIPPIPPPIGTAPGTTGTGTGTTGGGAVTGTPGTMTASPLRTLPGGTVTVEFVNRTRGATTDWVGLSVLGDPNGRGAAIDWRYLNGTQTLPGAPIDSGRITFTLPATPNPYVFTLYGAGDIVTTRSNPVYVTIASVIATPTTVAAGGTISVTITNGAGPTVTDWVALDLITAPAGQFSGGWFYLSGTQVAPTDPVASVTLNFTAPTTPGQYRVTLYQSDSTTVSAQSNTITVTP